MHTVSTQKKGVEIFTSQGRFAADAVVITLPLGVLKQQSVTFKPALSSAKQQAISRLGMGLFNLIAMRFTDIFWPQQAHGFFLPDSPTYAHFVNGSAFLKRPILFRYAGGKTARALETTPEFVVLEQTLVYLRQFFKQPIPQPEKYFITHWSQYPWSLGTYSYLPVGASAIDRDILAEPESNCLFFAGEGRC